MRQLAPGHTGWSDRLRERISLGSANLTSRTRRIGRGAAGGGGARIGTRVLSDPRCITGGEAVA